MKEIIVLQFNSSKVQTEYSIKAFGENFNITTYGVNFDLKLAQALLEKFKNDTSVIALSGIPNSINLMGKNFEFPLKKHLTSLSHDVPIEDGQLLRETYIQWQLSKAAKNKDFSLLNNSIGFFCATAQFNYLTSYLNISSKVHFADPYFITKFPLLLSSYKQLAYFIRMSVPFLQNVDLSKIHGRNFMREHLMKIPMMKNFLECNAYVINETQIPYVQTDLLENKILVTDSISSNQDELIEKFKPSQIISFNPSIEGRNINFTLLASMLRAIKENNSPLVFDEVLPYLETLTPPNLTSQISSTTKKIKKFGFLIHPLKKSDLFKINVLKPLLRIKGAASLAEKLAVIAPTLLHGKITGIQSAASPYEVEGNLYIVPLTPKMLLKANPELFYQKVQETTKKAKSDGCEIFGLGAYTKIVGDAGVTINKLSPIPVTTGNSLSAASTLWAANYAIRKMGFIEVKNEIFQGKVMIIGATGSIGKVLAKLVSQKWKNIILIAPKPHRLLNLKEEIETLTPNASVIYGTDPNKFLHDVDLVITTTSNQGSSILDITRVRPGAVICDVSRPFDISEEEAQTRPDILVIASGEVELPGNVKLTNTIGLNGTTVYACLAETAILALENKLESFSLSRTLSFNRVKEIDRLARKHGVKLAAIMGHNDEITSNDIELCRQHALKKRSFENNQTSTENWENNLYV